MHLEFMIEYDNEGDHSENVMNIISDIIIYCHENDLDFESLLSMATVHAAHEIGES